MTKSEIWHMLLVNRHNASMIHICDNNGIQMKLQNHDHVIYRKLDGSGYRYRGFAGLRGRVPNMLFSSRQVRK